MTLALQKLKHHIILSVPLSSPLSQLPPIGEQVCVINVYRSKIDAYMFHTCVFVSQSLYEDEKTSGSP